MKRFAYIFALLALILSGCYDSHELPQSPPFANEDNCDIAQLQELCKSGLHIVTSEMICIGRITSSDRDGNFYRSIVVEDESGGIEIKLGTYNSAEQYPIGLKVALHLKGTAIMFESGVVQVGLPPRSYDSSPREMEAQEVIDDHIRRSDSVEPIEACRYDIASLDSSVCGRLIVVEGLHYAPLNEEDSGLEGYSRFADEQGNDIFVYVSPYADFAGCEIPTSEVAIRGVLYHETVGENIGKQFVIKPRFKDDISTSYSSF